MPVRRAQHVVVKPETDMKKTLLLTGICGMMLTGTAFSQHTQSISFTPSGTIFNTNDTFTVNTTLTYSGYQAYGLPIGWKRLVGHRVFSTSPQKTF